MSAPASPNAFGDLIGLELVEVAKTRLVGRMFVRAEVCNPMRTLHGGAIMAIADSLGAVGAIKNLPEGASGTTTLESKTNFIGPAREGEWVIAECTPVHVGRRTSVWTTRVSTEAGKLVAIVTQTQLTL